MKIKLRYGLYVSKLPSVVFEFLCDVDRMPEWQSHLSETTSRSNATARGKLQRGTKVHDRRNVLGKHVDAHWEVIDYDKDKKLHLKMISGTMPWETIYILEAFEGGTFLSALGDGDLGQVQMSALAAHRACQSMFERDLNTLSEILER